MARKIILYGWLIILSLYSRLQAQPFAFNEETAERDGVFGVSQFSDSFLLVGVQSFDNLNFLSLRILDLTGKELKRRVIDLNGKSIVGISLKRVDDDFFLLFQTDFGKSGNHMGYGIVKLDSCLNPAGSMIFYVETQDVAIYDLKKIDATRIALTVLGVSDNHSTLMILDHINWQYKCSQKVFRTFSPVLWTDDNTYYVTGAHYSTKNGTQFSKKLGVHKFDDDLNLIWYKSFHQNNPGIYDQINFVDNSQTPWRLWGTTRREGLDIPIVYAMDSAGRIWDSVDLECTERSVLTHGNSVSSGNFTLTTISVLGTGLNQYVVVNCYNKQFEPQSEELELFNPDGSTQLYQTLIYGISTLYDSVFLVYGITEHPGTKQYDAFCNCYTRELDTCVFNSPPQEVNIPCIAAMDSVSYLTLVPDTVVLIRDSLFQKEINYEDFTLWLEKAGKVQSCVIFPNPGNGNLGIELGDNGIAEGKLLNLQVYSVKGELLTEVNTTTHEILSRRLESLPEGIYFIKVILDNELVCEGRYIIR